MLDGVAAELRRIIGGETQQVRCISLPDRLNKFSPRAIEPAGVRPVHFPRARLLREMEKAKGGGPDEPRSSPVGSMLLSTHGADATFSCGIGLHGGGPL